ncbi:MAG: YjjG family noncanonical pyrimidine nucleotidase [Clostridia bacterium]|nr:YjjG family noncanonical pyrimidine nucleotidase [Clostridia bacterium]
MIDTVLLDVDDTLLDFTLGERTALRLAFDELELPYAEDTAEVYHVFNNIWWARYERGEVERENLLWMRFADLLDHYGLTSDPKVLAKCYEGHLTEQHCFIEGATDFIARLRPRRLYAVSNGNANVQKKRLQDSGLIDLLDGAFVSEAVGYHKPQKEYFDVVFSRIPDFNIDRTILVGDSLSSDIQGGINAGLRTILYDREGKTPEAVKPDYHCHSFDEVVKVIESL